MRRASHLAPILLTVALAACGSLGGDQGGSANLPNRGIVPYVPLTELPEPAEPGSGEEASGDAPVEEPEPVDIEYVLVATDDDESRYRGPSARVDGDRIELVFERKLDRAFTIERAVSSDGGRTWEDFVVVATIDDVRGMLVEDDDEHVTSPAILQVGGTTHVVFGVGDGTAIAHATSTGGDFTVDPIPLLTREEPYEADGIGAPSLAVDVDGRVLLYYQTQSAEEDALPAIALATASDDFVFTREGVVMEAGTDCVDTDGSDMRCWDADGVGTPEVRVARTGAGRTIYRMFYGTFDGNDYAGIGFASSRDGRTEWARFPYNPVVDGGDEERDPTNLYLGDHYVLLYARKVSRVHGIQLLVNDRGQPSETF